MIGRQGDTLFQQCDGYVDADEIERAIQEEDGISNDDVMTLPIAQATQVEMLEAERIRREARWRYHR